MSNIDRLDLLEQKMTVLMQEINAVLGETHAAMAGLARANHIAMQVIEKRLEALEGTKQVTPDTVREEGVEL